jgi:hypothetical protein
MPDMPSDQGKHSAEITPEMLKAIPSGTIFSYNLDDTKTPGGMKVRWKVRVANGPEAARWDARQAEAIREALEWVYRHLPPPAPGQDSRAR